MTCLSKAEEIILLESVIKEVKENNPEIKILQNKYLADKQNIAIVKTWEYPQGGFEYSEGEQMYSVSQLLPFPGKLSLKQKIARCESEVSEQELNSKIREIIAITKKFYWSYWMADKMIDIYKENIDLMKGFADAAKTQYTIGKVPQTDLLKANIELAEMEKMLIMLEQEKISVMAELNTLLNQKPGTMLGKPQQPSPKEIEYTYEVLEKMTIRNSPEIKARELLCERNTLTVNLSKIEWYPDIMTGIKISNKDNTSFMVQISLPLYYKKQNSIIEKMKKEKEMAEWALESIKINTLKELRQLWTKYESLIKSVRIYETNIIPLSKQALEITAAGYSAGKNNFLDLLDSQKRYLEYNINYYKLLAEKEIILSEVERVTGIEMK
jgi:outer membrane protein TolC